MWAGKEPEWFVVAVVFVSYVVSLGVCLEKVGDREERECSLPLQIQQHPYIQQTPGFITLEAASVSSLVRHPRFMEADSIE